MFCVNGVFLFAQWTDNTMSQYLAGVPMSSARGHVTVLLVFCLFDYALYINAQVSKFSGQLGGNDSVEC